MKIVVDANLFASGLIKPEADCIPGEMRVPCAMQSIFHRGVRGFLERAKSNRDIRVFRVSETRVKMVAFL